MKKENHLTFLKDVFLCSLGSYGGPEAHYGVFQSYLVKKKGYLSEDELSELIGLYTLVPGPSSTQTITAIGYHVGGKKLAILSFLVWALPAIVIMGLFGLFFGVIKSIGRLNDMIQFLPAVAIGFILYAGINMTLKIGKNKSNILLYTVMLALSYFLVSYSMWIIPGLLFLGGLYQLLTHYDHSKRVKTSIKLNYWIVISVIGIAIFNEIMVIVFDQTLITLLVSFYRYGYQVIGGGQVVIPLMITDLVQTGLISLEDFLAGYAIDQAIPGPLFSFASFIGSRAFSDSPYALLIGILSSLSIFLPGILLVFFIYPLWKQARNLTHVKHFLKGITITASSVVMTTGIKQVINLDGEFVLYGILGLTLVLLLTKKISAPLIVVLVLLIGLIF